MINDHPIEEVIRGRLATIRFGDRQTGPRTDKNPGKEFGFEILPQGMKSGPGVPKRLENMKGEFFAGGLKGNDTEALWKTFLQCSRDKNREPLSTPELVTRLARS